MADATTSSAKTSPAVSTVKTDASSNTNTTTGSTATKDTTTTNSQPAATPVSTGLVVKPMKLATRHADAGKPADWKSRKHRHHVTKSTRSSKALNDSDSDSDSEASAKTKQHRKKSKKLKRNKKSRKDVSSSSDSDTSSSSSSDDSNEAISKQLAEMTKQVAALTTAIKEGKVTAEKSTVEGKKDATKTKDAESSTKAATDAPAATSESTGKPGYKRVDRVWDKDTFRYKTIPSVEEPDSDGSTLFNVRRDFDFYNHPTGTWVELQSKPLKEALKVVLKEMKDVSLNGKSPTLNPKMLFHYQDEIKDYAKELKRKAKTQKKEKERQRLEEQSKHCKVLLRFIEEEHKEETAKLKPMLKKGLITFDLMWAIYKPTDVYLLDCIRRGSRSGTVSKSSAEFRVGECSEGKLYCVQGTSFDYDGKTFGTRFWGIDIKAFTGTKKINSLEAYPLAYHDDAQALQQTLGMGFMQKPRHIEKTSINSRIMVDRATFRRINPNYPFSYVKAADVNLHSTEYVSTDESDDSDDEESHDSDEGGVCPHGKKVNSHKHKHKRVYKFVRDRSTGKWKTISFLVPDPGERNLIEPGMEPIEGKCDFSEEELLLAPPVVYGFAFQEKLWCEFSIDGISDIDWNAGAFDSLVVPDDRKDIIKAVVESHRYHATETIDDIVRGKGKGFVCILHGPPGVGKTLTAEGIAELLKCPLYMVTSGELGIRSDALEKKLQQILDVAHTWGAVLLLDEADVFLEQRRSQDVARNAMVSVFLRVLEYFQGILFLTTNQVQCFDEAFGSRIHLALKYGPLSYKAKRSVWKIFLDKCAVAPKSAEVKEIADSSQAAENADATAKLAASDTASSSDPTPNTTGGTTTPATPGALVLPLTEKDYDYLASRQVNGRQIKNAVKMAQALAVNEGKPLGMTQIKKVLGVHESFTADWKGGDSYLDAMKTYV